MKIVKAKTEHLHVLIPLFNGYRIFYEQDSNIEAAKSADVIVLGVKPFLINEVCQQLGENVDLKERC